MENKRSGKKILGPDVVFNTEDVDKADMDKKEEDNDEVEIADEDDDLEEMSREELLQKAKDMGLDVNANMSKEDLIKTIRGI